MKSTRKSLLWFSSNSYVSHALNNIWKPVECGITWYDFQINRKTEKENKEGLPNFSLELKMQLIYVKSRNIAVPLKVPIFFQFFPLNRWTALHSNSSWKQEIKNSITKIWLIFRKIKVFSHQFDPKVLSYRIKLYFKSA